MDILSMRLRSHGLVGPWFQTPGDVVKYYGCMQGQDVGQAMRVLWSRISGSTLGIVKKALCEGSVVRTWPMRGTLHYMAPEYVHMMLDLCASKTLPWFAKRREFLSIADKDANKALELMERNLKGGRSLTRTQMGQMLLEWGVPMQTQWVYHLTCYAATCKLICFWPPSEKEESFVLLDEWVKKPKTFTRDEQLAGLARIYLRSHGPATIDDLAWRCGLGKGDCKKGVALIENELQKMEFEWKIYYYTKDIQIIENESCVKLLGGFDEYFLGHKDRSIVADPQFASKYFTKNGIFFPLIMVNGKIIWTRKRSIKKDTVTIQCEIVDMSVEFNKKELEREAERYAYFMGAGKYIIQYQ
jgi:hypothetical protein